MATAADEWSTTRSRIPGLASLRGRALPGHVIATNELTGELLFEVDEALSPAGREGRRFRRLAVYAFEFEARPDGLQAGHAAQETSRGDAPSLRISRPLCRSEGSP